MEITSIKNSLYFKVKSDKQIQKQTCRVLPKRCVRIAYPDNKKQLSTLLQRDCEETEEKEIYAEEDDRLYNEDCGGLNSVYVKMIVKDRFIFIIKRHILVATSRIISRMLKKQSKPRVINCLHFREIKPDVMKEFCIYATYATIFRYNWEPTYWMFEDPEDPYHDSYATRKKIGSHWQYNFPTNLAYDLHILANFFMC
ncbi:uncharacterized protein [Rhodnius prolixus]|uniref:uncharacterized protein n=1 Tax=Rhodnius prolixus TaxID=13249 RepID=UPI003D18EA49